MKISDEYHKYFEKKRLWETITWFGIPMWKLPNDALILQEIIWETGPDVIIETGTGMGGSALFYASILKLFDNRGIVVTIDKEKKVDFSSMWFPWSDAIVQIIGSSDELSVIREVEKHCKHFNTMVILDSFHSYEYVTKELQIYSRYVSEGCYLVVEDTHVSGHPVEWKYGKGPYEAVQEFLSHNDCFEIDLYRERLEMTFNPHGYLRRVK